MEIKKGISLVAFGLLFILINLNMTLNGRTLNIAPDFIGWILLFFAFGNLGKYADGYRWLRWIALILAVLAGAMWVLGFVKPEFADGAAYRTVNSIVGIGELVFIVLVFGPLIRIARDYGSKREGTLKTLRILDLIFYAIVLAASLIIAIDAPNIAAGSVDGKVAALGVAAMIGSIAVLVCAVITVITIFGLRKEVIAKGAL